jgi:hypothetical protein
LIAANSCVLVSIELNAIKLEASMKWWNGLLVKLYKMQMHIVDVTKVEELTTNAFELCGLA